MRFAVVAVNTPDRTDMACFLTVGVDVSGIGFSPRAWRMYCKALNSAKDSFSQSCQDSTGALFHQKWPISWAVFLSTYSLNVRELSIMKFLRLYPPEVPEAESRNFM